VVEDRIAAEEHIEVVVVVVVAERIAGWGRTIVEQ